MGDGADLALEAAFDDDEARFDYRCGVVSEQEAFDRGIIDELGYEYSYSSSSKTCRCCKKSGLTWGRQNGRWLLFDGAQMHKCPVNPFNERARRRKDEFPN